jgi:hypothetical protein
MKRTTRKSEKTKPAPQVEESRRVEYGALQSVEEETAGALRPDDTDKGHGSETKAREPQGAYADIEKIVRRGRQMGF